MLSSQNLSNEVLVNALNRFYPEVSRDLKTKIVELIPSPAAGLERLPEIIKLYCEITGIEVENITGRTIKDVYVKNRKELLAVLMMFYHPEKIHGMTKKRALRGLIFTMSFVLRCRQNNISNSVPEVIVHFRNYKSFSSSVLGIYDEIKNNLK